MRWKQKQDAIPSLQFAHVTRSEAGARFCPVVPIEYPCVRRECSEELAGHWHLGNEWIVLARCLRTTFGTQELAWHKCMGCVILPYSLDLLIVSGDWIQACFRADEVCWGYLRVFLQYIHFNDIEWNYGVLFQKRQQWRPEMCLEYVLWRHREKPRKAEVRTFEQLTVVLNSCMTASSCITAQTLKKCVDHFL